MADLKEYCFNVATRARAASRELASVTGEQKQLWLRRGAELLRERADVLVAANDKDIEAAPKYGLTDAAVDRLRLTEPRLEALATALEEVAALPEPIGQTIWSSIRPNGLEVRKVRVALGVIFFIYESRPNVTADAAALCVKSGNAVILRGGKEASHSNRAIADILAEAAREAGLPADAVQLVSTADRAAVGHFLKMDDLIDVTIPRGGESLIRRVTQEASMPVIKHFAGNCHVYVDRAADVDMACRLTVNSKCQRLGVCNAAESLVVHADIAAEMLPAIAAALRDNGVEIRGCEEAKKIIPDVVDATEEDFAAEYLDAIISVKVVGSIDEAIDHINRYSSGHTETIVTADVEAARQFTMRVDSSAVMVNASTRFNDGGQFGLGAEIGISTDKLHARGPCGIEELTGYKYVVYGTGQERS